MWRASPTKVSPTKDDVEAPPSPTLRRREARRRAKTTSADSSIASLSSFVAAVSAVAVAYSLCVFLPAWTRIGAARWRGRTVTVCPRPSICAEGWIEVLLLAVARTTAYAALPYLVALFLTKARVAAARWEENVGSILVAADNLHETHEACGWRVAGFAVLHTIAHFARWLIRRELRAKLGGGAGRSGLAAMCCCAPVLVLVTARARALVSFEIRKAVHVLLGISGTVAVVCHTRVCAAVAGAALAIYGADALYALCYRALRVEDAVFERLGASVQVSFQKPEWWHDSVEGYVYVLIPWLSRTQWHPFSAYGAAAGKKRVSLCITAAGDWTRALHDAIERPTTRPIWVQGPFPSPYAAYAADRDNLLLVATGIGITPALATIQRHAETRSMSLLWMVRDAALVTFYLREGLLDAVDIALVFYTGKTPLSHLEADLRGRSSVYLVDGRPGDLGEVVLDVVEAVETHQALPECRFRPTELLGGYGGGPENGAPARFDALLRRCAARGMGASEISASFRTETLHRARSRSLADRPRPGRADGRLRRTMGPWANFGTVDGGDESDDDGDLVSEEDIASGIDLLSTSQMLVEDDDLGDILRHIAAGKRALTYSALVSHCERVCRGTQDEFELLMSVVASSEEPPRPKRAPRKLCANWGLMYCGNVVRVERDLRAIGRQIDAPVAVERFDW